MPPALAGGAASRSFDVEIVRPLLPAQRIVPWNGTKYLQVIYIDYLARPAKMKFPVPGDDVAVCRYFTKDEVLLLGDELHEDTRLLLERAGFL